MNYESQAQVAGVIFEGMQERGRIGAPIPLFTDPLTTTTFSLNDGETVHDALMRKRQEFGIGRNDMDKIESKAPFWRRWAKHITYNRARANYLDAFARLSEGTQEVEIKRLVAHAAPKCHIHHNPTKRLVA